MSEENKRLFFLQLPHDFFGSRRIKKLRKLPDGDSLVLLYLKIQLSTLSTGGVIELSGLEEDAADEIALEISEEPEPVRVVLNFMLKHGLAVEQEDGNIFLPYVEIMTTSHTEAAERMRKSRERKKASDSLTGVTMCEQCYTDVTPPLHENTENANTGVTDGEQCYNRIKNIELESKEQKSIDQDRTSIVPVPDTDCPLSDDNGCGTRIVPRKDVKAVLTAWNAIGLTGIKDIKPDTERGRMVKRRILDYGTDAVLTAIQNVGESDFLMGRIGRFQATFDWFIRPNNFQKVLEGNYRNRSSDGGGGTDNIFLKMLEEEYGQT